MTFYEKFYSEANDEIMQYLEDNHIDETDLDDLDNLKETMTQEIFNTTLKFETKKDVINLINGSEIFELMEYYNENKDDFGSNTTVLLEICNYVFYHIGSHIIYNELEQIINCNYTKTTDTDIDLK